MTLRAPSQKIVVAIIYICGMLMNSLDSTIVTSFKPGQTAPAP